MNRELKKLIRLDGVCSLAQQKPVIDIFKLDQALQNADPEYDADNCTYKGEPCSMNDYVQKKFGDDAIQMIKELI